jgi:hypothetical protein
MGFILLIQGGYRKWYPASDGLNPAFSKNFENFFANIRNSSEEKQRGAHIQLFKRGRGLMSASNRMRQTSLAKLE